MSPITRTQTNIGPNNEARPESPTSSLGREFLRYLERGFTLTALISLGAYIAWTKYLDEWQSGVRNSLASWQIMHSGFEFAVDPVSKQGFKSIDLPEKDLKKALFVTFTQLQNCQSTMAEIQTASSVSQK